MEGTWSNLSSGDYQMSPVSVVFVHVSLCVYVYSNLHKGMSGAF